MRSIVNLVAAILTGAAMLLTVNIASHAEGETGHVKAATAITEVFGDGQRLTAVAVEYDQAIDSASPSPSSFAVDGRTVTRVYANTAATPASEGTNGNYVVVELSPDDPDAVLYRLLPGMKQEIKEPKTSVTQTGPVTTVTGDVYPAAAEPVATSAVNNLIVDDFKQFAYTDPDTGDTLNYNLFVPRNYDPSKSYPLVLFMHDAGASSTVTTTTLVQGLGAVIWASPEDQARREAFVLAPQFPTPVVNDESEASSLLDTTVNLVGRLAGEYSIDRNRFYATGQSGGAMMSIAMNIKFPDLFAASFIVAGQWDPTKVQPLAGDRLWIVVSEGDLKAYPGQNAITAVLEQEGAKVSRAVWSGRSTPEEFRAAIETMGAEGSPINYVALQKGTVVLPGQEDDGGSNHIGTWRIAYTIDGIRDWIFQQHK